MKIEIQYVQSGEGTAKTIGEFLYSAEVSSKQENNAEDVTELQDTIKAICEDYRGDYLDHYLKREADVYHCFLLDENKQETIFTSDPVKKIDPTVILDGLVRRMKVDKITMSSSLYMQTFEGLSVYREDSEDIVAEKYQYEYWPECNKQYQIKIAATGNDVRFMFPYCDSGKVSWEYRYNHRIVDNCIPFCFLLEGKCKYYDGSPTSSDLFKELGLGNNDSDLTPTSECEFNLQKQRVMLNNYALWLLKGDIKYGNSNAEGIFCAGINREFYTGIDAGHHSHLCLNSWYEIIVGESKTPRINVKNIEKMIKEGPDDESIADPSESVLKKDVQNTVEKKIRQLGWRLFEQQGLVPQNDTFKMLTEEQTKRLSKITEEWIESQNMESKELDSHKIADWLEEEIHNLGLTGNELTEFDVENFLSMLEGKGATQFINNDNGIIPIHVDDIVNQKKRLIDYFANYNTAVHEVGHAVAIRLLFGERPLEEITIAPNEETKNKLKFTGYVKSDWSLTNLEFDYSTYEKRISVKLGGKVAEEIFFGASNPGWGQDLIDAKAFIIDNIIRYATFDYKDDIIYCYLPNTEAMNADDVLDILMEKYLEKTRVLLSDKKDLIFELAGELMLEETMDGARFNELYDLYEEKQKIKKDKELCEKIHFAIEVAMQYNKEDKASEEFISLFKQPGKKFIFDKLNKEYPKIDGNCAAIRMIESMFGFLLFSEETKKQIVSKVEEKQGGFGVIVDQTGERFAVFIDGSDRTGHDGMVQQTKPEKFTFETIGTDTNYIYANDNYCAAVMKKEGKL